MTFVQSEYLLFLTCLFAAYWAMRSVAAQNLLLLLASAFFYGYVHPWFLILLFGSALLDFTLAQLVEAYPSRRRLWVGLSVAGNLGLLGWFKYADFFVENVAAALDALGLPGRRESLGILLPVGISFYTFQTLGYTVDVARGELRARKNLRDYLLFVSFFPQLVAGPIERAGRLLPQLERPRSFRLPAVVDGLGLLAWGAFKKLVVADTLAPFVDKVFVLEQPAGPLLWTATAGFMIQIYADFSGYTDLARGSAKLLGFELQENFREPFLATTTSEFWQRWHISLSFWVRDYLLGPLVGDGPVARWRFAAATLTAFAVIGFWHGASWNFLLFGVYHGVWVILYGLLARPFAQGALAPLSRWPGARLFAAAFHLVAVGLVGSLIFREQHLDRLVAHFQRSPWSASETEWVAVGVLGALVAAASTPLLLHWAVGRALGERLRLAPWGLPLRTTGWAMMACGVHLFFRTTAQDFVYFQF